MIRLNRLILTTLFALTCLGAERPSPAPAPAPLQGIWPYLIQWDQLINTWYLDASGDGSDEVEENGTCSDYSDVYAESDAWWTCNLVGVWKQTKLTYYGGDTPIGVMAIIQVNANGGGHIEAYQGNDCLGGNKTSGPVYSPCEVVSPG